MLASGQQEYYRSARPKGTEVGLRFGHHGMPTAQQGGPRASWDVVVVVEGGREAGTKVIVVVVVVEAHLGGGGRALWWWWVVLLLLPLGLLELELGWSSEDRKHK
jgi:hypothetical protein